MESFHDNSVNDWLDMYDQPKCNQAVKLEEQLTNKMEVPPTEPIMAINEDGVPPAANAVATSSTATTHYSLLDMELTGVANLIPPLPPSSTMLFDNVSGTMENFT